MQLAEEYGRCEKWIRNQLDDAPVTVEKVKPQKIVIIADMTFIKRTFGVCVFRSPHLKKNLVWRAAKSESADIYHYLRLKLERQGFELLAAVIDGKPGIINVFWDIPVQMCQFHQIAIVTRYLTSRPKLPAGQELRKLVLTLHKSNAEEFSKALNDWHQRWELFLKEKTFNPLTKRWFYTHKRVRSAYRSLNNNLGILFTYQKYPELNIPNTTNSLDGYFSHVKDILGVHRGLKAKRKYRLISEILSK
jgi:hypothetical protein